MTVVVLATGCSGSAGEPVLGAEGDDGPAVVAETTTTTTTIPEREIPHPCDLLSQVKASEILATAMNPHPTTTARRCVWVSAGIEGGGEITIALVVRATNATEQLFLADRDHATVAEDLTIGDRSYFRDDGRFPDVSVLVDTVWFVVFATGIDDPVALRAAEEAAANHVTLALNP